MLHVCMMSAEGLFTPSGSSGQLWLQDAVTDRKAFVQPCLKCSYEDCRCQAVDEARFQDMLQRDAQHCANQEEAEVRTSQLAACVFRVV
jgi:hypothetical protein